MMQKARMSTAAPVVHQKQEGWVHPEVASGFTEFC